jgi:hypothetical protein
MRGWPIGQWFDLISWCPVSVPLISSLALFLALACQCFGSPSFFPSENTLRTGAAWVTGTKLGMEFPNVYSRKKPDEDPVSRGDDRSSARNWYSGA